ncbi:MAG: hypothetical protein U1A78_31645 [Polyangia bacterium]
MQVKRRSGPGRSSGGTLARAAGFSVLAASPAAWACSGPGAASAIQVSGLISLASLGLTVLCFLATLLVPPVRRLVGWRGVLALLLGCLFHPAIWLSTLRGDCGYSARWLSLIFLPLLGGLLAVFGYRQRAHKRRRRPDRAPS